MPPGPGVITETKIQDAKDTVTALFGLMKAKITSRDIMTKEAFENAIRVMYALGGSTNAVLHTLALVSSHNASSAAVFPPSSTCEFLARVFTPVCTIQAHEAEVDLVIDDFNRIGDTTPLVANLKPHGKYSYAGDFDSVGGLPVSEHALMISGVCRFMIRDARIRCDHRRS